MNENKNYVNEETEKDFEEKSNSDWGDLLGIIALASIFGLGTANSETEILKERVTKLEGKIEMLEHIL